MSKIILATNNAGKIAEFSQLLSQFQFIPQGEFDIEPADETGLTFIENSILKARHACQRSQLPAIADDSGLVVPALNGEPGIYSARYSNGDNEANIQKLLHNMQHLQGEQRSAHFFCVITFMQHAHDPCPIICEGRWQGQILFEKQGEQGFGYDPVFFVPDKNCSSAQLPRDIKNQISHRGLAIKQLFQRITNECIA